MIGYDRPLATVNLDIKRGERLGIVGDNGIGKSTLLKTLVGDIKPLSGDFRFGVNVQIGYFDQRMAQYTSDKTVIDDYHDTYPDLTQTQVRNQLGAFLFTQDEVYKEVSALSGGERVRLCLAKIFHTKPNVLILDEPTNHMDMIGKETLEAMLASFPGTVIFVSHDRYFVKKVATQILDMRVDGAWLYPFGYEDYESRERPAPFRTGPATITEPSMGITTSQAERLAGKEADRRKRQKKKLEDKIESIEKEIEELKEELCKPEYASMYSKLTEIQNEIDAKEEELLNVMEEWDNS